ncbi:sugar transferase [Tenuifilum thalassicum]|uniref:Sugar transferase n=1 Tax=Tenuifilum thalassicum TaxID=2590900 RepID=A0A7D3XES9_9BACT|nr:sugar transferase [Tenuifilum thalassicum]QKG80227.1 sugar transferase [Tenuifilum thalassicum]
MYKFCLKRFFDIVFSLILLILFSPLMIVISILIKIINKTDIFFKQPRPGKDGVIFNVIKFKTMTDERDENGILLPDEYRLKKFGKFLRDLSLDELPQLINVLKGDMSFIGPRPLLPEYLSLYSAEQLRRHQVRPGITGWAQVNGRNNISWTRKFELDVWYVDNMSFCLDLKILLLTIKKVVMREGVSKEGFATTEPFNGKN